MSRGRRTAAAAGPAAVAGSYGHRRLHRHRPQPGATPVRAGRLAASSWERRSTDRPTGRRGAGARPLRRLGFVCRIDFSRASSNETVRKGDDTNPPAWPRRSLASSLDLVSFTHPNTGSSRTPARSTPTMPHRPRPGPRGSGGTGRGRDGAGRPMTAAARRREGTADLRRIPGRRPAPEDQPRRQQRRVPRLARAPACRRLLRCPSRRRAAAAPPSLRSTQRGRPGDET
jgi:hypothetical protein